MFTGGVQPLLVFWIITFTLNFVLIFRGLSKGIEAFCIRAMPVMALCAFLVLIRVLTLGTPDPSLPDQNVVGGLGFMWNPQMAEGEKWYTALFDAETWLAAAGQIFFTLSVGFGMIVTYTSYMKKDQDIVLTGLSAASLNNITEVILGGSIAIPAAVAFFGVAGAVTIAHSGAFDLGFVSLSAVFSSMPAGRVLGFLWFFLLFFAGLTSSVSLMQPVIAFFEDEFSWSRSRAVLVTCAFIFVSAQMVIFWDKSIDEMDFWAGTIGIVLFGFIELILFMWAFGGIKAWHEINRGAVFKVPKVFFYIMRYVTPLYLLVLLGSFAIYSLPSIISEKGWQIWVPRLYLIGLFGLLVVLVLISNGRKRKSGA